MTRQDSREANIADHNGHCCSDGTPDGKPLRHRQGSPPTRILLPAVTSAQPGAATPEGLTRQRAMERLHVRASDGRVLSGAAAFVEVWARLPKWRALARSASLPAALAILEWGYRGFLRVRPVISRLSGKRSHRNTDSGGASRL